MSRSSRSSRSTGSSGSDGQPATVRVARWSATHPWRAIALWVVFVVACVVAGGAAGSDTASPYASNSTQAKRAMRDLRTELVPATGGAVPGTEYAVGGETAANADFAGLMGDRLPLVIGSVLLLTFVMMAVTFRSVVVALTAIAVNLLSAGASFGLLVLVFQHSWAEGLLDFRSSGTVVAYMPLFIFAVLFGLSMDYHVFVVGRIREAALRGMPTREAVADGITRSAGVVTSAADGRGPAPAAVRIGRELGVTWSPP